MFVKMRNNRFHNSVCHPVSDDNDDTSNSTLINKDDENFPEQDDLLNCSKCSKRNFTLSFSISSNGPCTLFSIVPGVHPGKYFGVLLFPHFPGRLRLFIQTRKSRQFRVTLSLLLSLSLTLTLTTLLISD